MASKRALSRARALVGVRFRPQGRDPLRGLDCVGLVAVAFNLNPRFLPDDYRLSSPVRYDEWLARIDRQFRRVTHGAPGDLVALEMRPRRIHLGILSEAGLIHADARRGGVIEGPWPDGARLVGVYRQRRRPAQGVY